MSIFKLVLFLVLFTSCGILEPREVIGIPKTINFTKDGFICQASAVMYAYSKSSARKDKWHFQFSASVINVSADDNISVMVEFVILSKISKKEIEYTSIYLGRIWEFDEERSGSVISDTFFSTKEVYETSWSARLLVS